MKAPNATAVTETSFRALLQEEYQARIGNNPRYSLRAFASLLKVDSSHLAKIIKGQRSVSRRFVDWAGATLSWEKEKVTLAKHMPDVSHAAAGRKFRKAVDRRLTAISMDQFEMVSRLIHYLILELTELPCFQATPTSISIRLGARRSEVNSAIRRLKRIGAIVETPAGRLRAVKHFTTTKTAATSEALKRLQREILNRACRALEEVPIEERDQSGITMAINSANIPRAKERIKVFRRELVTLLQEGDARDRVYQLSVSLFPLERGDE